MASLDWVPDGLALAVYDLSDQLGGFAVGTGLIGLALAVVYAARQLRRRQ